MICKVTWILLHVSVSATTQPVTREDGILTQVSLSRHLRLSSSPGKRRLSAICFVACLHSTRDSLIRLNWASRPARSFEIWGSISAREPDA